MGKTVKLFMVHDGRWYGYTENMLTAVIDRNGQTWSLQSSEDDKSTYVKGDQVLTGTWETITLKDVWLASDQMYIEDKITLRRPPFTMEEHRRDGVIVERFVQSWSLTNCDKSFTPTEDGIAAMPYRLAELIKAIVVKEAYGEIEDPLMRASSTST